MLEKHESNSFNTSNPQIENGSPSKRSAPLGSTFTKERRRKPRKPHNPDLPSAPSTLKDYVPLISAGELDQLELLAQTIRGASVRIVGPNAVTSEALDRASQKARLLGELGITVTLDMAGVLPQPALEKAAGQGKAGDHPSTETEPARRQSSSKEGWPEDFILLTEPADIPALAPKRKKDQIVIWYRVHHSVTRVEENWDVVRSAAENCDAAVIAAAAFAGPLSIPQYVFYPSVDPLSNRNRQLDPAYIEKVCTKYNVDRSRPTIIQISAFGLAFGQLEILHAYRLAKRYLDFQLVLVATSNNEDSEARSVLAECLRAAAEDRDIKVLQLFPPLPLELNALERAATVIVHTPTREAFGVAVAEALWKAKPVIANAVGSISNQIIHKFTGALVHSVEGCAYQMRYLLTHPEIMEELGKNGREHVKENFLITSDLKRWLVLFQLLRAKRVN